MLTPSAPSLPSAIDAIVIGASAGAIDALGELLPFLPATTPWPVVIVVHLPPNQPSLLASLFARKCAIPVLEAEDKLPIVRGIWFAPPDYHLLVESSRTFALSIDRPLYHSRPAVDVLFETAAEVYGARLVAIVLTGANSDGADGAKAVRDAGGFVVVQDPTTAEVATMPAHAIERAHPQWVATIAEIGRALRDAARVSES
jgi:two-component system, chemotaxis family, protein-glutamate methylesterase/glutaminase